MIVPTWFSQPFRPDGGITAEGLRNQLGRPALSVLTVLVRESAQNSWDAKCSGDVDYRLDLVSVSPVHRQAWSRLLSPGVPSETFARSLPDLFRSRTLRYLAVSDRGTTGLGGPTRSDVHAEPNRRAWLSFVLNSGEKQDVDGGGGTYGYGKGAFFLASRVSAVLIHTRFLVDGRLHSRLIGSALLSSTTVDGVPYTGRHWWGIAADGYCEPLTDEAADSVAADLGLPGFRGEETGTTVVVLDPDLSDPAMPEDDRSEMSVDEAGRFIADAAGWNLWPLTVDGRDRRLNIMVTAHGARVEVPSEHNDAVIANFAAAYRLATAEEEPNIRCGNPKKALGRFAYVDTFGATATSAAAAELGLSGSPHHVCCMRSPELVVQYLEQPAKAHPESGYAGVFKVEGDLDGTFAKSEPPTHDAWVDAQLSGREATFVRVYKRRLNEKCAAVVGPKAKEVRVTRAPVGPVAHRLGFLLSAVGGSGAAEPTTPSADTEEPESSVDQPASTVGKPSVRPEPAGTADPPVSKRQRRPVLVGRPYFRSRSGRVILAQKVRVFAGTVVRGAAAVITGEGGTETAEPAGSARPEVLGWQCNGVFSTGETFEAEIDPVEADLLVKPVEDAAVEITVELVT